MDVAQDVTNRSGLNTTLETFNLADSCARYVKLVSQETAPAPGTAMPNLRFGENDGQNRMSQQG